MVSQEEYKALQTHFRLMPEKDLLALCLWREARGEIYDAKVCVAHVILNRVRVGGWFGKTVKDVILRPYQFSSFNREDVNVNKFPQEDDLSFKDCKEAVEYAYNGGDYTLGATYYYDKSMDAHPPCWALKMLETIISGDLRFFKTLQNPNHSSCTQCSHVATATA